MYHSHTPTPPHVTMYWDWDLLGREKRNLEKCRAANTIGSVRKKEAHEHIANYYKCMFNCQPQK